MIAITLLAGIVGCRTAATPSLAEQFASIQKLMTQAEVIQILGQPPTKRSDNFPDGHFMGPQEGLIGVVAPGQAYEEWKYTGGGNVYLIFFAGARPDDPQNQWNVVGKIDYPQGTAF